MCQICVQFVTLRLELLLGAMTELESNSVSYGHKCMLGLSERSMNGKGLS
jgi:hypothetical protein